MIWRLVIVSWALALLAGLVVYFFADIVQLLGIEAGRGLYLLHFSELLAQLLAITGTVALCVKLLLEFVFSVDSP